jgi:hypothetical protein
MQNSQISGDIGLVATQAGLRMPNVYRWLNDTHQQKFNFIATSEIINQKLGASPVPAATTDLKINSMIVDAANLSAPIALAPYTSGNNLVIPIGTTDGLLFRPNATILNKNGRRKGILVSSTATSITIAPYSGQTLSAADWAIGTYVTEAQILVADRASGQQKGRNIMPRVIFDNLNLFRVNREYSRVDFAQSFIDQAQKGGSTESALVTLQLKDMAYDMMCQMEYAYVFGEYGTQVINNETANTQMGFIQSVDERGGVGIDSTTPITWSRFISLMGDVFDNYNADYNEIIILCGSKFRTNVVLSAEGQGYKTTAGKNSVLEGSGLDFMSVYGPLGKLTFVNLGLFNDKYMMPSTSSVGGRFLQESALFFSVTTMKDNLGNNVPLIQDYYGNYGGNGYGIFSNNTPGIIDKNGKFVSEAYNQVDSVVFGQTAHCAKVTPNAQPCGYFLLS